MPAVVAPTLPKGTRDFLPEQMFRREFVINTLRDIFERYGYEPLQTPSIEKLDVLSGKYGDEGERLIFKVLRRGTGLENLLKGEKELVVKEYRQLVDEALRYDLTVPLSRVVAMHHGQLTFPFKRYQIQPVWRADRPQRGRYREFFQCDVDTVGTDAMLADAETVAIVSEVLTTLGFSNFKIRINNRKLLNGLLEFAGIAAEQRGSALIAIDKIDKIGMDGVRTELSQRGIEKDSGSKLLSVLEIKGDPDHVLSDIEAAVPIVESAREGTDELKEMVAHLVELEVQRDHYQIDLCLARGLGYYTGPIYESVVEEPNIGSLSGGGRYDNLIGTFLGRTVPATGTAFGIERIIDVMGQLQMFPASRTNTAALVAFFDESTRAASVAFAQELRRSGVRTEHFFEAAKMKKQFSYADKKGIPFVLVIGPDELREDRVTLKELAAGEQKTLSREAAIRHIKKNSQ